MKKKKIIMAVAMTMLLLANGITVFATDVAATLPSGTDVISTSPVVTTSVVADNPPASPKKTDNTNTTTNTTNTTNTTTQAAPVVEEPVMAPTTEVVSQDVMPYDDSYMMDQQMGEEYEQDYDMESASSVTASVNSPLGLADGIYSLKVSADTDQLAIGDTATLTVSEGITKMKIFMNTSDYISITINGEIIPAVLDGSRSTFEFTISSLEQTVPVTVTKNIEGMDASITGNLSFDILSLQKAKNAGASGLKVALFIGLGVVALIAVLIVAGTRQNTRRRPKRQVPARRDTDYRNYE